MLRRINWLGCLILIAACSAPDDSTTAAFPEGNDDGGGSTVPRLDPFVERDGRFYDAQGREVLLRGLNARVAGLFDVTFDDGRIPLQPIPAFGPEDCRFIAEDLGMNHLRLPVNWSAIEPRRDEFDPAYTERVREVAAFCAEHGVYTLVDLHQDAYGKDIGEDGAPLWAIVPPPEELLEGPLDDLAERRTSPQVLRAFESFWENAEGLQDEYAEMAAWLASEVASTPGVIGLDLMNEPIALRDPARIDTFHARVGTAVRAVEPDFSLFFEPNAVRNFVDRSTVLTPFDFEDTAYAPHIYTEVFQNGWQSENVEAIEASVAAAREEAEAHQAGLYVGEFGNSPDERGLRFIRAAYQSFDRHLASAAWWVYEEASQDSWGLYDAREDKTRGALREHVAQAVARAYPAAIAGHLVGFHFDDTTAVLDVEFEEPTPGGRHLIAIPKLRYPNGVRVFCDGEELDANPEAGRIQVMCEGRQIRVEPRS